MLSGPLTMRSPAMLLLLLLLLLGFTSAQWKAKTRGPGSAKIKVNLQDSYSSEEAEQEPEREGWRQTVVRDDSERETREATVTSDDKNEVSGGGTHFAVRIVAPKEGELIRHTPFQVILETSGGFTVPEDGEIMLTMSYPGRGDDVRVLQSTVFNSWNLHQGEFTISATLVSTKDEPVSPTVSTRVSQIRGPHFVLTSPEDDQLHISQQTLPVLFHLGGVLPQGSGGCVEISCTHPRDDPFLFRQCTFDEGNPFSIQDGQHRLDVKISPGNCTITAGVSDANGSPLTPVTSRVFRVVDEQYECPGGSGVTCHHGECVEDGEREAHCECDPGYHGKRCLPRWAGEEVGGGRGGVEEAYLHMIKSALLDTIYAKDRPGETKVNALGCGKKHGGKKSCILMAAILRARGTYQVWVVDSFEGCPKPDPELYPADNNDQHHTYDNLRVSLHKVTSNLADFGLASSQVEYVKGWFHDTMYTDRIQNIENIALLRLDGDLYQSTIEACDQSAHLSLSLQ
ncbi:hypothetical protein GUITHDRAFT_102643 [Guillardia theta CCMP2712]|uniref:EGF-like domain-containing protein n=1 Tax=Guillardia theta (strain CCMP2712) TaxID=905079 RepID=L1JSF8_GUITC|nr:hypothetical protein GUITHDRAFT_102643 [Guillardia theta CCMP2712]EKX51372.1 hypothetical protein GUITHDRAFT_102643 [Guillardia theta CCMP2712]|eukprot:XP_005838352.1 hypothetical protein GUITHDRAFT_102643 [Guillardia theta CCMP2712]